MRGRYAHFRPFTAIRSTGDPFDRLLAAQGLGERAGVVSADAVFGAYGITRVW